MRIRGSAIILLFVCPAFALLTGRVLAADGPSDGEIKTIIRNYIEGDHWGVGMVVGIVDEHGTRLVSYGKLDEGDSAGVDGDTLFEIGSITKTFTAILLQDMIARCEMRLDDPVEKYLPVSVKVPAWGSRKITLLDLATHRSGLPRDLGKWTIAEMYQTLGHYRLRQEPGRKWEYCNLGMALLAHAIELKAGTNYEVLVRERICRPLGMASTCITPTAQLRLRWATSHGQENRVVRDILDTGTELPGAGSLRSTANDMLKYAAANAGLTDSSIASLMEKTHVVQIPHLTAELALAMPWGIYHRDGAELIWHGGNTDGQSAFVGFNKELKRGVVVLANRNDPMDQAVERLGPFLLHPPENKPAPVNVSSEVLNSCAGLYQFPDWSPGTVIIRREGDHLRCQILNSAGSDWFALSDTEFVDPWQRDAQMQFARARGQRTTVTIKSLEGISRGRRVLDSVPPSLLEPMSKSLAASECVRRNDSDLQGTWDGTLRVWYWPFQSLRARLRIAETAPGMFRAEIDIPASGLNQQPVVITYRTPEVIFMDKAGYGIFLGKVNSHHTKIAGRFNLGHSSLRITLRRADR